MYLKSLVLVAFLSGCSAWYGDRNPQGNSDMSQVAEGGQDLAQAAVDGGADLALDNTPPTVSLAVTPMHVTAAGNLSFVATVSSAHAITEVKLFGSGVAIGTLDAPAYSATSPITAADNGVAHFMVTATDELGNVGSSASVTVTVEIGTTPTSSVSFVAADSPVRVNTGTAVALATPAGIQANDFLIAFVDVQETSANNSVTAPNGWTLLGGYPIHNGAHSPYIIPATENQGTWVYYKFAGASEPSPATFMLGTTGETRAAMIAYRGVKLAAPIHDKAGFGYYGEDASQNFTAGNTTLATGLEVDIVDTAQTDRATFTVTPNEPWLSERLNTGESADGLNLIVQDQPISFNVYLGPSIQNMQSPANITDEFDFTATTLVLAEQ